MVINILHSIGDIIFCEPIYRHYWQKEGIKPTVVIRDHLMWLQEYIESAKFLAASKYHNDIDDATKTDNYLPLRFANQAVRGYDKFDHHDFENCMPDKYVLAGLDPELWKTLQLNFYVDRSGELFAHLDLSSDEDYILINENCQAGKININPKTNMRIIRMVDVPGYTVCDWAMVMLLAKENHHVSTSTFFLLEALKDYRGKIFIYARPNEDGLRGISKLNPSFHYKSIQ